MALQPVADGTAVVACNTCRHAVDQRTDAEGVHGGARLVAALRSVQASDPRYDTVQVQEMPCLFACQDFCTIHLRSPGKIGYVLGKFDPSEDAARAILDYALRYDASEIGQVPYREWPEGVKGHFLTRTPPLGFVVE
jgi:predicted metal-binding protein